MVGAVGALISGWLTPTSLFILLNIVVVTILISSAVASHPDKKRRPDDHHLTTGDPMPIPEPKDEPQPRLGRAPSLFSRVTSFNLTSNYYFNPDQPERDQLGPDPPAPIIPRAPSLLSRVASFRICGATQPSHAQPVEEEKVTDNSEEKEDKGEARKEVGLQKKEGEKPPAVRKQSTSFRRGSDEGVDAKADDFINRFKQQLKLQRLKSLLRFRNGTTTTAHEF